jgi:uncharacterized MAPEG superfamily protein
MKTKRLAALAVAGAMFFGAVTQASAHTATVNRAAMNTRYSAQVAGAGQNEEAAWIVSAARAVYSAGTRVANTPAVRSYVRDATLVAIGALFGSAQLENNVDEQLAGAFD